MGLTRETVKDGFDHVIGRVGRHGFGDRAERSLDSRYGVDVAHHSAPTQR